MQLQLKLQTELNFDLIP